MTETIRELEEEMLTASNNLEFEKAALLRDQVKELKRQFGQAGGSAKDLITKAGSAVSYRKGKRRNKRSASCPASSFHRPMSGFGFKKRAVRSERPRWSCQQRRSQPRATGRVISFAAANESISVEWAAGVAWRR